MGQVLNQQCSQTMAFVVAGFSKVYVGEIIEKGKSTKREMENGKLSVVLLRLNSERNYGGMGPSWSYTTRAFT